MATPPKDGKLLYHLTSIENLEGILRNGLTARISLEEFVDVAENEIIQHRNKEGLNKFIPFHFFGGNPFDGAVQHAHTEKVFVFICLLRSFAKNNKFKILTQHPLSLIDSTPLEYEEGIDKINWELMQVRDYFNRECKETCMAECLSPNKINAPDFYCVYVANEDIKIKVEKLRDKIIGNCFHVYVNPSLFVK